MNHPEIEVATVLSVPFEENCYVVHKSASNECFIVDPGLEPDKIVRFLQENALVPTAILNTHGHADHFAGNETIKQNWPEAPVVIGAQEAPKLTDAQANLSAMFAVPLVSNPADVTVEDGEIYATAGYDLLVRKTPGHSSGHVVFILQDLNPQVVFVGDLIFYQGIGRTDFPDGNFDDLAKSIREVLFTMPDDTVLLSGHGPPTTVGSEKRENPFVGMR